MNNERQNSCNTNKDHIKGIKCDVRSCVYHDCDTHCTASQIAVCNSASNAACETFKEKK
jgi:hypothetical protein